MPVDVKEAFAAWRTKHARRAWRAVCVEGGAGGAQFGGSPLLGSGERWPSCESCDQPMQFFLQLPLASLPRGFSTRGEGTLQLFYCSQDDGSCETWRPFSGTHVVRLLSGATNVTEHPDGLAAFPLRSIERWSEFVDYPHPEEHDRLGLVYDYDFTKRLVSVSCDDLGVALRGLDIDMNVAEAIAEAEAGDKLGGWPLWIQSIEYPSCPQCGRVMELVFQVDSEDNVPHMFGDVGCGHITQCPDHPHVLAFGWACS
jgi:hypothetical protein